MKKFGDFIARKRVVVFIIAIFLLVVSVFGMAATKVNYDLLTYLPKDVDSINGLMILDKDFAEASLGIMQINKMNPQEVVKLKDKISKIDGVDQALWINDVLDTSVPKEVLPDTINKIFYNKDSTVIFIKFTGSAFSVKTHNAISNIRKVANKQCLLGGVAAIVKDTTELTTKENPLLGIVAVVLLVLVLALTMGSIVVPIIIFLGAGFAIIYNMGTNVFLSNVSSATIPLVAALQAGVTLNFSIFLYHRYEKEKKNYELKEEAMAEAISKLTGVIASCCVATIAVALAMMAMNIGLSKDIAIVCTKGIVLGLITTITIFPALILLLDKVINKLSHRPLVPSFNSTSNFVTNHYKALMLVFIGVFALVFIGKQNAKVNYNMLEALPQNLESIIATNKLKKDLNMPTTHFVIVNKGIESYKLSEMSNKIAKVEGISAVLGDDMLLGPSIHPHFIPEDIRKFYSTDKYKLIVVNSIYESGSREGNVQIDKVNSIVKEYDKKAMITGEGIMTKDLVEISESGFTNVRAAAIIGILLIIALIFGSLSIPIILVFVIEMAVFTNVGILFYTRQEIPYMISIVIGLMQLAVTVIYAIFLTARFKEELNNGSDKFEAMRCTIQGTSKSVVVGAMPFLVATTAAAIVSRISLVTTICILIASAALISMVVMIVILPAVLIACEGFISKTSFFWTKRIKKDTNLTEAR